MPPELVTTLLARGFGGLPRLGPTPLPARFLGRRAVLLRGPDGVAAFYDASRTARRGAVPAVLSDVLFGRGAVHGFDDAEHRVRKGLFTAALAPERVDGLLAEAAAGWNSALDRWSRATTVVLFDEAVEVLGGAVLRWSGVSEALGADPAADGRRSADLARIVDGFGSAGPRYLRARRARRRCEGWAAQAVRAARSHGAGSSALQDIATHRDGAGELLPEPLAAVELLNVLRPTVAVAWLVTQAAVALHDDPGWRDLVRLAPDERAGELSTAVAHEVRRRFPFVPALAARARRDLEVGGVHVPAGHRLVLDVVGTHRDAEQWPDPETFDPDRFVGQGECPVSRAYAPQGAGDARTGHRCPGEPATVRLLAQAVRVLCDGPHDGEFTWPPQDLRQADRPVPSRPASGVVLQVRAGARGRGVNA